MDAAPQPVQCQVVYSSPQGHVHLQIPLIVDELGALRLLLPAGAKGGPLSDASAVAHLLSRWCLGAGASPEEARRLRLQRALEAAIEEVDGAGVGDASGEQGKGDRAADGAPSAAPQALPPHRQWLHGKLKRVRSFRLGPEHRETIRQALVRRMHAPAPGTPASPEDVPIEELSGPPPARACHLSFPEQCKLHAEAIELASRFRELTAPSKVEEERILFLEGRPGGSFFLEWHATST